MSNDLIILIVFTFLVSPFAVFLFVKLATYAYFKTKSQFEKEKNHGEKEGT